MDKRILKVWDKNNHLIKDWLLSTTQDKYDNYLDLLKGSVGVLFEDEDDFKISKDTIIEIDNGDYQGTLLYVLNLSTYQPDESEHFITYVDYGSCSGCDTLQSLSGYDDGLPTKDQVEGYWTLILHMFQRMKQAFPNSWGDDE